MTMRILRWLLPGIAAALLVIQGCGPKPRATAERAPADTARVPQDESFDPNNLSEEDLMNLPDSRLRTSGGAAGAGKTSERSRSTREAAGFRVQIIATDSEAQARQVEQQASLDFQESVYLVFDPPNYKVRVGDCQTRVEANQLRDAALKKGFPNAWVVQSRVVLTEGQ